MTVSPFVLPLYFFSLDPGAIKNISRQVIFISLIILVEIH